jgi:putative transposase
VNRALLAADGARVNAKRVYRIMKSQGWLLARYTGKSTRTHDGVIITLRSNLRWCSDAFEIRCWSGERVQVAFSLDCCDREVMSYVATSAAITGEMIRDLMAESVERRFGADALRAPHAVEWLSDNGPPYTATETRDFGESLGLLICTTPAYSPESNGMAESFMKTFKRDYVYVNELHDAASVMRRLAGWFEDYNEVHPHKGVRDIVKSCGSGLIKRRPSGPSWLPRC